MRRHARPRWAEKRTAAIVVALLIDVFTGIAWPLPARGESTSACVTEPSFGDVREMVCPLRSSGRFRFQANFAGSHDDTVASLSATLDDASVACADGSKTQLAGEDGEVSLTCRFSTPRPQTLKVSVRWSHAQYLDSQLLAD